MTENWKGLSLLLFLLLSSGSEYFAQHTLVLDKPGRIKRLHFNPGDPIGFKLDDGSQVQGSILQVRENRVIVSPDHLVKIPEVSVVYRDRPFFHIGSAFLFKFTLVYSSLYVFNTLVFREENPFKRRSLYYPVGGLTASFVVFSGLARERHKIGNRKTIKTIELGEWARPTRL